MSARSKAIVFLFSFFLSPMGTSGQAPAHTNVAQPPPAVPQGWSAAAKRVKVLTPEGEEYREIPYYTNCLGMKFVLIPAGEFMMGSPDDEKQRGRDEGPQHKVRITKAFYMGAYEVTQEQYEAVMDENPAAFKETDNPVENLSWERAVEFCRRLSQKDGVEYRLPTEAEWEYACRAGSTTPFYTGATISTEQANNAGDYVHGNGSKGEFRPKTTEVGSFPPNGFGLYDMPGNVWEWCQDWYNASYYEDSPSDDPKGPDSGYARVMRGGSWFYDPRVCRSADRSAGGPACRSALSGLRVVCGL